MNLNKDSDLGERKANSTSNHIYKTEKLFGQPLLRIEAVQLKRPEKLAEHQTEKNEEAKTSEREEIDKKMNTNEAIDSPLEDYYAALIQSLGGYKDSKEEPTWHDLLKKQDQPNEKEEPLLNNSFFINNIWNYSTTDNPKEKNKEDTFLNIDERNVDIGQEDQESTKMKESPELEQSNSKVKTEGEKQNPILVGRGKLFNFIERVKTYQSEGLFMHRIHKDETNFSRSTSPKQNEPQEKTNTPEIQEGEAKNSNHTKTDEKSPTKIVAEIQTNNQVIESQNFNLSTVQEEDKNNKNINYSKQEQSKILQEYIELLQTKVANVSYKQKIHIFTNLKKTSYKQETKIREKLEKIYPFQNEFSKLGKIKKYVIKKTSKSHQSCENCINYLRSYSVSYLVKQLKKVINLLETYENLTTSDRHHRGNR